jgi:hypothetical protein
MDVSGKKASPAACIAISRCGNLDLIGLRSKIISSGAFKSAYVEVGRGVQKNLDISPKGDMP